MISKKSSWIPVAFGVVLILIGLLFPVPGTALTTYSSLDGVSTNTYSMGNKYSSIDEYVGGDAYNFIIGASLVAGRVSGAMTVKGIFVVGGLLCLCFGMTMFAISKKPEDSREKEYAAAPTSDACTIETASSAMTEETAVED